MKIALVNPNSTVSMTGKIALAARAAAPDDDIIALTCHGAPASIQGPEDQLACRPFLLEGIRTVRAEGADAIIIACFDDPWLDEARALVDVPVLGIGQAAYHAAMLVGGRFSVVTTLAVSVPGIAENIRNYGLAGACAGVRASGVQVLELEDPASGAAGRVSDEIGRACREDAPKAIVLGCAGMADLRAAFQAEHGLPVIDGVAAATALARALAGLTAGKA